MLQFIVQAELEKTRVNQFIWLKMFWGDDVK
jgi:hypothetical protein